MSRIFEELEWRGLVKQVSSPLIKDQLDNNAISFYCGFDPTADSLHVGSLLPLITMARLQRAGHKPIVVLGGATAAVGDPSFKNQERKMLSQETIDLNLRAIFGTINRFLDSDKITILNNLDWFKDISVIEFLRETGKFFTINHMMAKESVRSRLEDREQGISFTEFSYMLLQAQDFRQLFLRKKCVLQIGGSDQWGNSVAGIDLIKKSEGQEAFGLTLPLITKSDGSKFGKSETGNIWLDPKRTSPFDFFQFFIKTDDHDVIQMLKFLTFIEQDVIEALEVSVATEPHLRKAQKTLAIEMTKLVHGQDVLAQVLQQTSAIFEKKDWTKANPDLVMKTLEVLGVSIVDLLVNLGLAKTKGMAKRDIEGRGVSLNEVKLLDTNKVIYVEDIVNGRIVLSKGKSNHKNIKIED
jgi:tyrosyl-tRNA synthetase